MVYPEAGFAPTYGRLLAQLKAAGTPMSAMDLLIATAAVLDGAPVLTRNPKHFARIPEPEVVSY